ncbi:MAG: hypothetical protein GC205_11605 [Bacteroidetes bacterium]|nr:hypothetical protein [Bacteroidota bacterium]
MFKQFSLMILMGLGCASLQAQTCDPSVAPHGLSASYTVGTGVLLQWNPVPGSVGVSVRITQPSGTSISKRIVAPELDQLLMPELIFVPGNYTWRVQAACSTVPPYEVTPVSEDAAFTVPGSTACSGDSVVVDVEGNVYSTVQIGSQCWMRENLKTGRYANGDSIPTGLTNSEWAMTLEGASCSYSDLIANENIYGRLYNWYAVDDPRSVCPAGWHVPTDAEWDVLSD